MRVRHGINNKIKYPYILRMNSQKYNKEELYPEDFSEEDKLQYDTFLEQSKYLFPKLGNEEWLLRMGILAYMRKEKSGATEPPSQEEIAAIKNQYTNETVFYTEPIEEEVAKEIVVE
jgi:hypothetical protein